MFAATKHVMTGAGLKPVNLKSGVAVPVTAYGVISGMTAGDVSIGASYASGYTGYVSGGYTELGSITGGGLTTRLSRKFSVTTGDTAQSAGAPGAGSADGWYGLVFENAKSVLISVSGAWYYTYRPGSEVLLYMLLSAGTYAPGSEWTQLLGAGGVGSHAIFRLTSPIPGGGQVVVNAANPYAYQSWHRMIEISNQ